MKLLALPAFSDKYIWMLHDGARALVVDRGDSAAVQRTLDTKQLKISAILVTRRQGGSVDGVDAAPRAAVACRRALLQAGVLYARIDAAQPTPFRTRPGRKNARWRCGPVPLLMAPAAINP